MSKPLLTVKKGIMLLILLCLMTVSLFISNEARKEIFYLCGNFSSGTPVSSVTRQLDTANLSSYTLEDTATGMQIRHSSILNLNMFSCTIDINAKGEVVAATYNRKVFE